jgi:uncharacterized protein YbjT (DUF2867 family)
MIRAMKVLIAGASGLVGSELLKILEVSTGVDEIHVLLRRPFKTQSPKIKVFISELGPDWLAPVTGIPYDAVVSCLGTTIKKAGSKEQFRSVDFEAVLQLAQFAKDSGAGQFLVISSLGANSASSTFYSRVKGEMEDALAALGLTSVTVFRPSLLVGNRKEFRLGERIGEGVLALIRPMLNGPLLKYRSISASSVAKAIQSRMARHEAGFHVLESDQILAESQN